ncbi:DUF2126 domain-containing protein [Haloferula sp.]|uniref:transglutaminase family protein n=1 Tax=Haloferula sp. TaxID=2497595 RepID=UPI003C77167A
MSIHCSLHHLTAYKYSKPVQLGPQVIRLRPATHSRTEVPSYSLKITPEKHFINWQQDPQGNFLARVVFPEAVREFSIEVDLIANLATINPFDFFLDEYAQHFPFDYSEELTTDLEPYLVKEVRGPKMREFLTKVPITHGMEANAFMVAVNNYVHQAVGYTIRMEPGVQSTEETLTKRTGSCRDSAWLLVQVMRRLGIAARFCSGYLIQLKADQKPVDGGAEGPSEDFTDLHAWTEIFLPGAGWVGLDPTSGLLTGEGHIPLCAAAHYRNAAPISGSLSMSDDTETDFEFDMKVERIRETPRVTLPYTPEQTAEIEKLGQAIDKKLKKQDMRLTMGGEPTFVSATDMEAPEWNTDALGPTKELYADQLLHRLYKKFSPGGFLHHGQGKWYPGEPLPRWSFTSYWRHDGTPVWNDQSLFADHRVDYGYGSKESEAFIKLLAKNLDISPDFIRAGYEDIFYYMWKERRLPMNVTVENPKLADKLERETISKVFEQGLGSPVGHLLPIARGVSPEEWITGPWFLRGEELYLAPGNHPMGYRLPMDGLPWAERIDQPILEPYDPSIPRDPFPAERILPPALRQPNPVSAMATTIRGQYQGDPRGEDPRRTSSKQRQDALAEPQVGKSASGQVRTGLSVEPRDGRLHVFMPPLVKADAYLELVGALEETAKSLGTPIRIEGYKPPSDPRLNSFSVTPDPGVIEVNIHPSKTWNEIVSKNKVIYEEARNIGLGTEKFMEDGRHSGTGGGNHIVVGGDTPLDSPFLRRPHLLPSLITYFNNHPSLSYLFSGLFIGPTSQAPRLDEARHETLYELETAFSALPKGDTTLDHSQWLVDRILRNHLVDMTGNTHRAEICLDKLYSPDSTTGRLGLLEMRGFEMPPHPEMALAQQLLIRGLLSRFWDNPYTAKPVRWGTSIHDKWMLPHFIKDDMEDIVTDLRANDLPFDAAWFEPHHEFRFPLVGEYDQRNLHLELRQAIEPWHVLGEEQSSSGTSRYVDSSVERLQLKVSGFTDSRHQVTCNGVSVPLHPTGRQGEYIAGIRYRAWDPYSALHPTLPINSPLTFDVVDTWNQRSVGGCKYHVVHPGGRAYDDFPLNAFVAESRRRSRFFTINRSPGKLDPPAPKIDREYPMTLDLQRYPA